MATNARVTEGMTVERVQTGIRMEKRLLKVLKALAELKDMSVGDLLEGIVLHSFEGKLPFSAKTLKHVVEFKAIYGLTLGAADSHNLREKTRQRTSKMAITLVNPEAASPAWKGKRGEAFEIIENFYSDVAKARADGSVKEEDTLTVGKWLEIVVATPSLTKVGFGFLRFYEAQGLIKLTPVAT